MHAWTDNKTGRAYEVDEDHLGLGLYAKREDGAWEEPEDGNALLREILRLAQARKSRALAEAVIAPLFVAGNGEAATTLSLISQDGRYLGGWSRVAAIAQVRRVLVGGEG